jgi:phosphoserine phosphatase
MEIAGLSVGFHAKGPVRSRADVLMDVRDLRQVLPLLGLPLSRD